MVKIRVAKENVEEALLAQLKPLGLKGVGIGKREKSEKEDVINLYVERENPELLAKIPPKIAGYPVNVIVSGRFYALGLLPPVTVPKQDEKSRLDKWRPALGGIGIAHYKVTRGTLTIVHDGLVWTNNHVGAASSTVNVPRAMMGDPWLQPAPYDGGVAPDDVLCTLVDHVPIATDGVNYVDFCRGLPLNPDDVLEHEILDVGTIEGFVEPQVDMEIQKSGASSGLNAGQFIDVHATVDVDYYFFEATFKEQCVSTGMLIGGDSGSAAVTRDSPFGMTALGFAGSDSLSVWNRIENVLANASPIVTPKPMLPMLLAVGLMAVPLYLKR